MIDCTQAHGATTQARGDPGSRQANQARHGESTNEALSPLSLSLSLNETPKIIQTHDVYIDGGYIYIYIGEDTAWPNKRNSLNLRSVHMQCFPIAAEMSTKTLGIPKLPSDA